MEAFFYACRLANEGLRLGQIDDGKERLDLKLRLITGRELADLSQVELVLRDFQQVYPSPSGVAVRNSIILIEFIEQQTKQQTPVLKAIMEAGRARIRPILLTSLTSIAALLPIALSGDALFKPLSISIVSGLMFSTLLTLILTPAFYLTLTKIRRKPVDSPIFAFCPRDKTLFYNLGEELENRWRNSLIDHVKLKGKNNDI